MKYRRWAPWVFAVVVLAIWGESFLHRAGTFLVVDETASRADLAVTVAVTPRVIQCYREGRCGKILVLTGNYRNRWRALRKYDPGARAREKALKNGIKPEDIEILEADVGDGRRFARFLSGRVSRENVRSAVFFCSYYQTRRFRFYLDRGFSRPETTVFVRPVEQLYRDRFHRWWENTMLDNLFLEEYLRMGFYYFNKLLGSSSV